jgi:hypothetical protein
MRTIASSHVEENALWYSRPDKEVSLHKGNEKRCIPSGENMVVRPLDGQDVSTISVHLVLAATHCHIV